MKLKKIFAIFAASIIAVTCLASCSLKKERVIYSPTKKQIYKIGIVRYNDNTSLNGIRDSIIENLEALGYVEGENCSIDSENANGEMSTVEAILEQFEADEVDIIVAISTPCAQLASSYADKIPVVFSAVSDPVGAGVVSSLENKDKNITGTSDKLATTKILDIAKELFPEMKKLGYIYNANEDDSVSTFLEVKEYCENNGIKVVEANGKNGDELKNAAEKLAEKCDAVFAPNDNTVADSMSIITEVLNKAEIPLFVGSESMVHDGGVVAVGIDYSKLCGETANMIDIVLKSKKTAAEIPVKVFDNDMKVYVNSAGAKDIGIEIPDEILKDKNTIVID